VTQPTQRPSTGPGFTLIEILIVVAILGIIVASIAAAFTVIVRTSPLTETRIDDARSTRGLATWLSHDTTSTPRFEPPDPVQGGITVSPANDCSAPGNNILHLRWTENGFSDQTFIANYRYVPDGAESRVVRYTCSRIGAGAFTAPSPMNLTSGLNPSSLPVVALNRDSFGDVESITLTLTAIGGEQVLVDTGPRNPTDFFP
jgi:prepilin-type N-terminal cleavage/methylation domain-containing protein